MFPRPSPSHCGGFACLFSAGTSCPWSCVWPMSSQAQLKHHLLQTHLDSDHPSLGLGVCPLYFLGIKWIYLWCCTTNNANTDDSNITEASCALHNVPNTVHHFINMTTKLYHLITVIPISQLVTLRPERLDSMWKPIQLGRCIWILTACFKDINLFACLLLSTVWFLGRQEHVLPLYIPVTR